MFPFCLFCSAYVDEQNGPEPVQSSSVTAADAAQEQSIVPHAAVSSGFVPAAKNETDGIVLPEVVSSVDAGVNAEPVISSDSTSANADEDAVVVTSNTEELQEQEQEIEEDICRRDALEKHRKMQETNAAKAIKLKQRGDCLVADGLGTGAVLTLKVDYRTHSHAAGLVAIVYKANETGGVLVCCEKGVITHDGSKRDYWVPSDKYVINAAGDERVALPAALQKVRDDIISGLYDYTGMRRISYGKYHQAVIGANSPCKRLSCSCKKGCTNRCGCRQKGVECNSSCLCSGNCNRLAEDVEEE